MVLVEALGVLIMSFATGLRSVVRKTDRPVEREKRPDDSVSTALD